MANQPDSAPSKLQGYRPLGSLELKLMNALWASPKELSVQDVCVVLGASGHSKTVMTVLNRLVGKRLLERRLEGRAYKYRPRMSRSAFLESTAQQMAQDLVRAYGAEAAEYLATAAASTAPESMPSEAVSMRQAGQRGRPGGASALQSFLFPWRRKRQGTRKS